MRFVLLQQLICSRVNRAFSESCCSVTFINCYSRTPAYLLGETTTCRGKGVMWLSKKVLQAAMTSPLIIQGAGPWPFPDGKGTMLLFSRSRYRIGLVRGLASRLRKVIVPLYVASVRQCLAGVVCPVWVSIV